MYLVEVLRGKSGDVIAILQPTVLGLREACNIEGFQINALIGH